MNIQRKHLTFQEKLTLINDYKKSPLSAEKFAIQNGVGHSTFMRWRRELISAVVSAKTSANRPATSDTDNLFLELTQPIEHPPTDGPIANTFLNESKANDFSQNSRSIGNLISFVITTPNGITIKVDALAVNQLASVVNGLLP